MRGRNPESFGTSLSPRGKRVLAAIGIAALAAVVSAAAFGVFDQGSYNKSQNGCVTVLAPSSTGGAITHQCGAAARTMCKTAYTHTDKFSRLTRPQCRLAGISPAAAGVTQP